MLVGAIVACRRSTPTSRATAPGAYWPGEPAGFKVLTDYGFGDAIPTVDQHARLGETRWQVTYNSHGYVTRVSDSSAPLSSPYVAQFMYPAGMRDGHAPGTMYWDDLNSAEVYVGFWWKVSNPWQEHPAANKIAFLFIGGHTMFLYMYATNGGKRELRVQPEFASDGAMRYPNVTTTDVALGVWHRIEWYVKYVPGGEGVMKWWLDGVMQGNHSNMNFPGNFTMFQFSPTWGGNQGDTKTETEYYWYDHVRLSVPR